MENLPIVTTETLNKMVNGLPACLAIYTPSKLNQTYQGITTLDKAIESGAKSLLSIAMNKESGVGKKSVVALLKIHLFALNIFLKQKNGLTTDEIDLLAEAVYDEHGDFLNFADINVIFRNAKLGRYGNLYESLTCAKIMQWFEEYAGKKVVAYENIRIAEKDRIESGAEDLSNEQLKKNFGYRLDDDGKIMVGKDAILQTNKPLPPNPEALKRMEQEHQKQLQKEKNPAIDFGMDKDYLKFERERKYNCIMMKPAEIRTDNEKNFVAMYEATYKTKKL